MFNKVLGAAAVATALVAAAPTQAATVNYTFSGNTALSGTPGNSYTVTVGGVTVTATAWYTGGNASSDLPQTAYLGRYGSGLGVTNAVEGNGNSNNSHTTDNVGSYDFIRLEFSTDVKLAGWTLNGFDVDGNGSVDTDAWFSNGTTANTFAAGASNWGGYLTRGVAVASGNSPLGTNYAKVWLIGADRSGADRDDGFKLGGVSVLTPAVPEPATWGMMIMGFGVIGGTMRRRKTAARVTFA